MESFYRYLLKTTRDLSKKQDRMLGKQDDLKMFQGAKGVKKQGD